MMNFEVKVNVAAQNAAAKAAQAAKVAAKATIKQKEAIQKMLISKGLEISINFSTLTVADASDLMQQLIQCSTIQQRLTIQSYVEKGVVFDGDIMSFKDCSEFIAKAPVVYKEILAKKASDRKVEYAYKLLSDHMSQSVTIEQLKLLTDEELDSLVALEKEKMRENYYVKSTSDDLAQFKREQVLARFRDKNEELYANSSDLDIFKAELKHMFTQFDTEELADIANMVNNAYDLAASIGENASDYIRYKLRNMDVDVVDANAIVKLAKENNLI